MPRYDYDCVACGRRSEVLHGVHDDAPAACPLCGGAPLKKAFAPPTIHFKGSGWAKKERRATAPSGGSGRSDTGDTDKPTGDPATKGDAPDTVVPATGRQDGSGTDKKTDKGDGSGSRSSGTAEPSTPAPAAAGARGP
ncbi:MAG: zinc ribbon domain-containing protein, partial [Chloroflexota bacterium]